MDHQKILKMNEDKNVELENDLSKNRNSIRDLLKKLNNEKDSFLIIKNVLEADNNKLKDKIESDCNISKTTIKTLEAKLSDIEIACNQKDKEITQLTKAPKFNLFTNIEKPKVNFCFFFNKKKKIIFLSTIKKLGCG